MSGEPKDRSQAAEHAPEPDEHARMAAAEDRDTDSQTPGELLPRLGARLIDGLLLAIPNVGVVYGLDVGTGWLAPQFVLSYAYFVLLDTYVGTTVGKRLLRLRVLGPTGDRPELGQAARREAFTLLSIIQLPWIGSPELIAWIVIAWTANDNPARQGKHDQIAGGTRVIKV